MTPDELRALADALEPMARAPRFEDFDVPAFCAWVRAQADAKPVGYVTANGLRSLRQDDATVLLYAHDYLIRPDHVALYTHPAPSAPQAEPKRDPNPDEVICPACTHQFRAIPENVQAQLWAKREPLSDERIELPDYLLLQIASTAAAHDVLVERRRQIESEGWTPEHDDEHSKGQLAAAAACYALSSIGIKGNEDVQIRFWPWDDGWWRPSHRRRDLVKAGALILAEIERLDR